MACLTPLMASGPSSRIGAMIAWFAGEREAIHEAGFPQPPETAMRHVFVPAHKPK